MMAYDGAEAQFQLFLTLTYEYEWSASRQNRWTASLPHPDKNPTNYPSVVGPQSRSESFTVTDCLQDVEPLLLGCQYIHIQILT